MALFYIDILGFFFSQLKKRVLFRGEVVDISKSLVHIEGNQCHVFTQSCIITLDNTHSGSYVATIWSVVRLSPLLRV